MICHCTLGPEACVNCPTYLGEYDLELNSIIWETPESPNTPDTIFIVPVEEIPDE